MLVAEPAQVGHGDAELIGHPGIAGVGGSEGSRAGGDAVGSEDCCAGAVDLPASGGGSNARGGDDDVELGGVLLAQQSDEVGERSVALSQLPVHCGHGELPSVRRRPGSADPDRPAAPVAGASRPGWGTIAAGAATADRPGPGAHPTGVRSPQATPKGRKSHLVGVTGRASAAADDADQRGSPRPSGRRDLPDPGTIGPQPALAACRWR